MLKTYSSIQIAPTIYFINNFSSQMLIKIFCTFEQFANFMQTLYWRRYIKSSTKMLFYIEQETIIIRVFNRTKRLIYIKKTVFFFSTKSTFFRVDVLNYLKIYWKRDWLIWLFQNWSLPILRPSSLYIIKLWQVNWREITGFQLK